jgi:hypothetical protein
LKLKARSNPCTPIGKLKSITKAWSFRLPFLLKGEGEAEPLHTHDKIGKKNLRLGALGFL